MRLPTAPASSKKALCGRCASRKVFAVGSVSAQFSAGSAERCGIQAIAGPNGPKYEVDVAQGVTANVGEGSGYTACACTSVRKSPLPKKQTVISDTDR